MRPTEDITPNGKFSNGYPLYSFFTGIGSGAFQYAINYANQTQNPGDNTRFTVSINKSGTGLLYGVLGGSSVSTYNPVNTTLFMSGVMSGSSGTNSMFLNGSSSSLNANNSGTFPLISSLTMYCFGLPSGQSFGYQFAEALVYGTTLTASQVQQVESYLAQKWGLTASLPTSHLNATQPAGYPTPGTALKRSMVPYIPPLIGYSNVRYVRFTGGFNGDTWCDLAELRIFDSEGTNLCSGKTINQATSASGLPVVFVTGINGSVGSGTEGGDLSSPQSGSRFIDGDITIGLIANQWVPLIDLGSNSTVYSGSFWYGRYPYRSLNAQIDLLDAGSNLVKRWTVTQVDSRPMSWTFPN
jgi:hypothetical protein